MNDETKPKRYDREFKADAVRLVLNGGRSIRQAATDLGMNHWTLRDWCRAEQWTRKQAMANEEEPVPEDESAKERLKRLERENARLRRQNSQLMEDREILKKAAAFFAKENE